MKEDWVWCVLFVIVAIAVLVGLNEIFQADTYNMGGL